MNTTNMFRHIERFIKAKITGFGLVVMATASKQLDEMTSENAYQLKLLLYIMSRDLSSLHGKPVPRFRKKIRSSILTTFKVWRILKD